MSNLYEYYFSTVIENVHAEYKELWDEITYIALESQLISKRPDGPLEPKQFRRLWLSCFPIFKIAPSGSDFCDYCVTMSQKVEKASPEEKESLMSSLSQHKEKAK